MPVAVRRAKRIERDALLRLMRHAVDVIGGQCCLVISHTAHGSAVAKLFPWAERSVVSGVDDDAQTLVGGHGNVEADEEEREHKEPPPAGFV